MKGIPTFRPGRLKQAAVLTGITALIAAGSVLGSGVAHASGAVPVSDLGNGQGTLGISEQSGTTQDSVVFSSPACPGTANGSAKLLLVDPLQPTASTQLLSPINNSVSTAFTFSSSGVDTIGNAIGNLFDDPAGDTAEIVVECYPQSSGNGTGVYENDVFIAISSDDSHFTVVSPPAGVTHTTTTLNASSPAYANQNITLTATVAPSTAAGTVDFEVGGTTITGAGAVPVSSGSASFVVNNLPVGTAALSAVFTPTNPSSYSVSTGTLSLNVTAAPQYGGQIHLATTVPAETSIFSITVDTTDIFTLTPNAGGTSATGTTGGANPNAVTVLDERNTYPGWSVSGQANPWTGSGSAAGDTIAADDLGYVPTVSGGSGGDVPGATVAPGTNLGDAAAVWAYAPAGYAAGVNGFGTSLLNATFNLNIPSTAVAGPYATTFSVTGVDTHA